MALTLLHSEGYNKYLALISDQQLFIGVLQNRAFIVSYHSCLNKQYFIYLYIIPNVCNLGEWGGLPSPKCS